MIIGRTDFGFVIYNYHEGTVEAEGTDLVFTGCNNLQKAVEVAESNIEDFDCSVVQIKIGEGKDSFDVSDFVPLAYWDLVDGKVFPDLNEAQNVFMALQRGSSEFALTHGLAVPVDTKNAIEFVEGLKSFK